MSKGIETDYLRSRLIPMLHSNSNLVQEFDYAQGGSSIQLKNSQGSPNIFVYPFSLNPEGSNPAGSVNMSKVSHAKLELHLETQNPAGVNVQASGSGASAVAASFVSDLQNQSGGFNYRVDVYALYWNWLQIKDGRACSHSRKFFLCVFDGSLSGALRSSRVSRPRLH